MKTFNMHAALLALLAAFGISPIQARRPAAPAEVEVTAPVEPVKKEPVVIEEAQITPAESPTEAPVVEESALKDHEDHIPEPKALNTENIFVTESVAPLVVEEATQEPTEQTQTHDGYAQKAPYPSGLQAKRDDALYSDPDLFEPGSDEKNITLNFENAELKSFIEYVADLRSLNIIPDKAVAGSKISLSFQNPVSKIGAWNALLAVMDVAGFAMIKEQLGSSMTVYKVVPKDKKLRQPLPTFIGVAPETLPNNDATIRYVKFLSNIPTQDVKQIVSSFLSNPHSLLEQPNVNALIITDKANVIKSAMKVVEELDQTSIKESVFTLRLKRANAQDVKNLFDSLISKPDNSNPLARLLGKQKEETTEYFSPSTKIIAEPRTNSLILLGNRSSLEKVKEFIVNHIDTELKEAASPLRIYELQHTSAEEVKEILQEVTSTQGMQSAAGQQAAKTGAVRGGVKYFKPMKFQADKEGNRLIVSCANDNDWELLKQTIKELDRAQPQVMVQMMIVTVSSKSLREFGGHFRNKHQGQIGKNINFQSHPIGSNKFERDNSDNVISILGNLANGLLGGQGSTLFTIGKAVASGGNLWSVFRALKNETDATLLSEPFLVTANRTRGELRFGDKRWINDQIAIGQSGSAGDAAGRKEVEAATHVSILPQINVDGIIKLDIDVKVREFVDESGEKSQEKNIKTSLTAGNGQVLALGGFVKTKVSEKGGKTPIIGDIPLLGWLGKNESRTEEKEYVFMFLCPTIIKPRTQPGVETYTKIKLHQAKDDMDRSGIAASKDPIHKWFFVTDKLTYSHKVTDFANARYQPTNVDIKNDPFYRSESEQDRRQRLHITDEAHSPQAYIKRYKELKQAHHSQQTQDYHTLKQKPVAQKKVIPAPTEKQINSESHPVENIQPIETITQQQPEPEITEAEATPEDSEQEGDLAAKRAQLKELLSSNSLLELLGAAEANAPQKDIQEEQIEKQAPVEEETAAPTMTRRRGLRNFLQEKPQGQSTTLHSKAGRKGLANFLSVPTSGGQ